jgi:hypothetical protein
VYGKKLLVSAFEGEATWVILYIACHMGELASVSELAVMILSGEREEFIARRSNAEIGTSECTLALKPADIMS